ncbi:MAG: ParB/RepB/Spo0J family partition protein [Turicibacter sp.]|nr:ParB/RepB/Spo0J family partition protein [Turicibacter sp.]
MRVERCEEEFFGTHTNIKNHNTSFLLFSSDEEDPLRYDFEIINHHQAILHTEAMSCLELVINEFLFYSGFISHIETVNGRIVYHQPKKKIISLEISKIQPSQLYINEKKLDRLLTWIKSPEEIIIPVIRRGTQWVSIDGHTRLKAAQLLGFKQIYVYVDEFEPYIDDFIQFCQQDKKFTIYDLPVISNEDYQIQWCLFCDQYFQQKEG